jgi:hypothetical protein
MSIYNDSFTNCCQCSQVFTRVASITHDDNGNVVGSSELTGDRCEPCGGVLEEHLSPFYEYSALSNGVRHLRRKTP